MKKAASLSLWPISPASFTYRIKVGTVGREGREEHMKTGEM